MGDDSISSGLNAYHRRALSAAFRKIEQLLSDVEAAASMTAPSTLSRFVPDLSPVKRQVIADYAARVRSKLEEGLKLLQAKQEGPRIPVSRAIETSLIAA